MYYVVYGFLWLLSLLPFPLLYIISDGIYFLVYYVFKYRKNVVMGNLLIAFPEKSGTERVHIAKKFYRNFTDMMVETIKMISASEKQIAKRFQANWEVLSELEKSGKSVQVHLGHNFNWEWGNAVLSRKTNLRFLAVYMPMSNKIFERLFYHLRTRRGAIFLRATAMREEFMQYRDSRYLLGLIADQSPGNPSFAWWFNFFGKPTPFLQGPARGAIANDTAVVFTFIHKPRRGYYEAEITLATEFPATMTEQELTQKFVEYMEKVIRQYPDMWVWSHRRWKFEWKQEYGNIINQELTRQAKESL